MPITPQSSLFEPANSTPVVSSVEWISGVLLGPIAVGLCILAVAFVGALMLTGRLPLRQGMRVALGCFVLLGAPVIAAGFVGLGQEDEAVALPPIASDTKAEPLRGDLTPAANDPYAGASLRRE